MINTNLLQGIVVILESILLLIMSKKFVSKYDGKENRHLFVAILIAILIVSCASFAVIDTFKIVKVSLVQRNTHNVIRTYVGWDMKQNDNIITLSTEKGKQKINCEEYIVTTMRTGKTHITKHLAESPRF